MLRDFQGYLQSDGYGGYECFDDQPGIELIHCMAHARRYIDKAQTNDRSRWNKHCLNAHDGMLKIDNNLVENVIRPLAPGRKNYLFAGSHEAAQRIAMFYSFFGTCARNEVEPYARLKEVLSRISNHPINKIDQLLPTNKKFFASQQS